MFYGSTTEATDWNEKNMNSWQVKLISAMLFFIPRANPDIEKLYPRIKIWLLEVNEEGYPEREIALGDNNQFLFCTPNQRNSGMWTDMGMKKFTKSELSPISKEYFESLWHET